MDGRDKSFIIRELIQNAWDESGVTRCDVTLGLIPGRPAARLVVEDDAPEGFYDLTHAYTLYAKTRKRSSPDKRGRFNLGEKQVLALCREAEIVTTKGTVRFLPGGKRSNGRQHRPAGSMLSAEIPMTHAEIDNAVQAARTFIPPVGIRTTINGEQLPVREPRTIVEATLATEFEDKEGHYRSTRRKTEIHVYEPLPGEKAMIYEMGLPILETGDRWHYDVQQRVPMNTERDNVRPAFLQDVRAEVLNAMAAVLKQDEAAESWVREAMADDRIEKEAFEETLHKRHGKNLVTHSVGDAEANYRATAHGYAVIGGGALSSGEWANAKRFESVSAASQVFPTERPKFSANGKNIDIPASKQSPAMRRVVNYVEAIGRHLVGGVVCRIVCSDQAFSAWYGQKEISLNLRKLGRAWFEEFPANLHGVNLLLLHELAHEFESNHLSENYYRAACNLGASLAELALKERWLFPGRSKL